MAEDATSSATDPAAALETYYDFSISQPHHHENDGEADIHLTGSSNDLSTLQNVSAGTATTTRSKGRLDSLKENMFKQQERLTALKERARQSQDDRRRHDSLETSLGQKLLPSRPADASTPLATPNKDKHTTASPDVSGFQSSSGNEKLLMLTQRTEQTRALIEQRKRDMAKSLLSVKTLGLGPRTNIGTGTGSELGSGSSMTDLRHVAAAPVSRHRSALDLEVQGRQEPGGLDENHVKMLKSRMKLTELKQSRQEQELQELRAELTRRAHLIEQLELSGAELQRTLTQRNEELEQLRHSQEQAQQGQENTLQEQENSRLQAEVLVMRERLAELENINDLLETTRSELQEELSAARERDRERETEKKREGETQAEQVTTTDAQVSQELAKQLQELSHKQAELLAVNEELRRAAAEQQKLNISDASVSQRLDELEATIVAQTSQMAEQSEELAEKTTELNVLNVNLRLLEEKLAQSSRKSKPLFLDDPAEKLPEEELQQLKQKLDEANKANIKLKLKCKQAEKQLQRLQSEEGQQQLLAKLSAENEELQQRITVLEDEKGQWQLASMERSQQEEQEEQQANSPNRSHLEAIRLLEEQKLELQQALEALQQGHESARVESELSEAQLEEQQLTQRVQQLESEAQEQRQQLETLQSEKQTLDKKLSHYISENMELLDKLEKLSSSSSAESIEIVERQQLEEQEQQQHPEEQDPSAPSQVSELTQTDQDDQETLAQLRERLELFTQERGEVLDKLEHLSAENAQLQLRLDESSTSLQLLQRERDREREKDLLSSTSTSSNLSQELSSMQRSSEVVATLDAGDAGGPVLLEKCEKSLSKLNSELEAYRRANDRQAKFNVSKKLAKEAKNCHTQLSELLHKVKEASTAVETVTVVETVVAVTAPNGKALAEYEQLTAQNAELKAEISRLGRELEELRERESYPERESLLAIEASAMHQEEDFLHLQSLLEDSRNAQAEQLEEIRELRESQTRLREEITQHQLQAVEASTMHQEEDFLHLQSLLEDSRNTQAEQLEEIRELRESQARLKDEITQHQLQAEQFDQQLNAKEMNHEKQLEQFTRLRRELESRTESLEGELSILQALVAEQKQQLIENLSESEHSLNLKMLELQAAQEELKELRELRRSQEQDPSPEQLREALRISKSLAAQQVSELGARQETIDALNQQIQELYQGLEQTRQEEQHKSRELREKLKKYALNLKKRAQENAELEEKVKELQEKNQEQEQQQQQQQAKEPPVDVDQLQQQVSKLNDELKAKIHVNLENRDALRQLKQQLQEQEELLDQRQAELQEASLENKELRRERQEAEQEVFQQGQEVARLSEEVASLQQQLTEQQPVLEDLRRQLESKSIKFDKSKELIKHRNATIQSLQRELQQLRQSNPAAEQQLEQLRVEKDAEIAVLRQKTLDATVPSAATTVSEEEHNHLRVQLTAAQEQHSLLAQQYALDKANFEATIARLNTIHEGIQAKLQEDASYIESLETQNAVLEARSSALEEQAASQAHRQAEAEDRTQSMQQQLRERNEQAEQQLQLNQQLQQRLQELSQSEEEQRSQLAEVSSEAEHTREQLTSLRGDYEALQAKHAQVTASAQAEREQLSHHSQEELAELQQQLAAKEAELHRQRQVFDAKLAAKTTELDELECDLSAHAERATNETRDLLQQLERTQEQLGQRTEELQRQSEDLQELEREVNLLRLQQASSEQDVLELQELRMQAIQDKTEADNLRAQIDALCANHSQELQALQQQIAELATLGQNQTDDQVYIETENKRLTEQLCELQAQLARQMPLPTPSSSLFFEDALAAPSPFDELIAQPLRVAPSQAAPALGPPPTIEDLQRNVSDLEKHAQDLENKLSARNQILAEQEERRMQLERRLNELELQIREREEQERLAAMERLIQPAQAPSTVAPTLGMFFGEPTMDLGLPQAEPVEEPLIQPKKAYLCQPKQELQQQAIDFSLDEDPWTEAAPLEPLQTRIAQLEQQLATSEQQKTELQTKTVKLMKRLKEYKTKAATTPTPAPLALDNDLDTAIIEELKHQLQLHESRQAKAEEQLQQHLLEKEKLAKRIDVLTAGNERMAELKERQDMEVQMYQARIRELQAKVSQLDQWGEVTTTEESATAPAPAPAPSSSSLPSEELSSLQAENQELNAECQDLQQRLKEERRLVLLAEETAAQSQAQWEQVQEQLREREQQEQRQQQAQEAVKRELQAELSRLRNSQAEAQAEIEYLRSCKEQKDQQQDEQSSQSHQLDQEQLRSLQAEVEQLRSLQSEVEQLRSQQNDVEHLRALQTEVEHLRSLQTEVEHLRHVQQEVEHLKNLQGEVEQLRALKLQQDSSQQGLLAELQQLQLHLTQLEAQRSRDQAELQALRQGKSHHEHDEQLAQLQEKESEIVHLKQRIEELMREDQTEKLVFEILTKNQELQMLRMQIKRLEEDREEDREEEQSQPPPPTADTEQLLAQCQQLQQEKADMEEELRVLNNHVLSSLELEDKMKQTLLQLDTKNIEITELRRSLEVMQQGTASQQQLPDLATINQQWEQVVEQKCSEVASIWQEHLVQREAAFKAQLEEISKQQSQSSVETTATPQAGDDMVLKMQKALETQEMEIVTLKEQLAIRSAEYARLAAQYDPFRLQNRSGGGSGSSAPSAQAGGPPSLSSGEPLPEYVLKADLDYALMMLHQRDMRVEEMIVELVQLLEERDHLQLKLSDTLRQLETERSRVSDEASSGSASQQSSAASSSGGETQQQPVVMAAAAAGSSDLKQKLAELQTVKHSKDKAIVDEREQRLQQMLQLQKDMAKQATGAPGSGAGPQQVPSQPPPTVGVDLTQPALRSPSMMLMDWIMGSSSTNSEGEPAAAQQD